jgi:RHS repeat-associated protein
MYDRNITINSSSLEGVFAVVEKRDGYRPEVHYVLKDNLGSWTTITYAWGNRRNASTWNGSATDTPLFDRGFTGHEHLYNFGLINMNGRVYDPYMSTFLSPDNYIQAPDNSQNFNRYAYCLNNPLKYTDPDGEFWHIVIGAVIGGTANLLANFDNCEGFWEGAAAFVVGAGAGSLTAATGGAGASVWGVAGVSALGGAATAATNSVIAQTKNNFTEGTVNWDQVGNSAVYGALAGFASGAAGYAVGTGLNVRLYDANIKSPLLQSMIVSPLAAGAGHIAAGTAIGVYNGKSFDQAVFDSFDGIGQSMAIGGAIGVASTISVCFWKGVNPIRGNMLWPKNNGFKNTPKQTILEVETIIDRYGSPNGTYAAPQGTPLDARSLPPNTASEQTLYTYKVVKPLPALEGTTSRSFWFNTRGGGTQYKFDFSIQQLINEGYLIPIY